MSYTEIPTDLLVRVAELVQWIVEEADRANAYNFVVNIKDGRTNEAVDPETYDFVVRFRGMDEMQPLIKWLEYISAVWGVEGERDHERVHRYCRRK